MESRRLIQTPLTKSDRSAPFKPLWSAVAVVIASIAIMTPGVGWAKKKPDQAGTEQTEDADFGDAALGRKYHEQIVSFYGVYEQAGLDAYVQKVGEELAAQADGDQYQWHFTVLDMEDINAFATPGGYVYITRGLLTLLNTEAQLAAVLGHEIGHIVHRHAARQHTAANVIANVSDKLAKFDQPGSFNLGNLFGAGLVRGYGREMELEADEAGARMISAVGHDPNAMLEVMDIFKSLDQYYQTMNDQEDTPDRYHTMLSSHPDQERRRRELVAAAVEAADTTRDAGRDELLRHVDGMAWSGSRSQGVIRGNRFLHQKMDFAVQFPDGWTIVNLPDRLIGLSPNEEAMIQLSMFDRSARKHKKIKVDQFLQKIYGMSKWQSARTAQVNGLDAFFATVPHLTGLHGQRTGRAGVIYRGTDSFVFFGTTKDADRQRRYDRTFDQIMQSLTTLDAEGRRLAEPVSLRVVRLEPGASLSDFAEIDGVDDPEAILRLINGLYPDGEPQPGQMIKTLQ